MHCTVKGLFRNLGMGELVGSGGIAEIMNGDKYT